jgi:diadenylate cyclase
MTELRATILNMKLSDAFDILVVALFFFAIFALLRESRSHVALRGFITVMIGSLVIFLIARAMRLQAIMLIFEKFWIVVVLVFLMVFQNEFKKAMTEVGQMRAFRPFFPRRDIDVLDHVLQAVKAMARDRIGALIVFERRNPLHSYTGTNTSTSLDAEISAELIRTIFTPTAPLHDGALIVSGERMVAAGCILPTLTDNPELSRELGTRHRAAIGVTEETDAVVVVVSEETGIVSIAVDGRITRNLKPEQLRRELERLLDPYGESSGEVVEDGTE